MKNIVIALSIEVTSSYVTWHQEWHFKQCGSDLSLLLELAYIKGVSLIILLFLPTVFLGVGFG